MKEDKSETNFKLINTSSGVRVSQACDRCRMKKIKCDGQSPCHNCKKVEIDCKISDKLTRRAFPKGYTENLERKVRELEEELIQLKNAAIPTTTTSNDKVILQSSNQKIQINNPIDQIFNLDDKGVIIGNDNLNFESQFNHLLINLNLPFLKITNSHNFLLNDPNGYLYNQKNNQSDFIYNALTGNENNTLPTDVYDLFIKLINNFKKIFKSKQDLDLQIVQYFLNYNVFIPIFDYKQFMQSYDAFHTMYPFIFTYDDSTINGFNLSNTNDYGIVNTYLMTIIQIYTMIMMNNPAINLNILLNHNDPHYYYKSIIKSIYDFLPYFNGFHVSIDQLQTYLLFLYYSLLTNNKEKSLVLSSSVNAFIGILGINLNSNNLFFNDLSLNQQQKRNRVKIFWNFKVLLKCFNLKFGFKPSLNTTVINPVTIDKYFQLTPEKLSSLLDGTDDLFNTLLKPSIEFLNLMNIIIPSSFSPNYYQYLKQDKKKKEKETHNHHRLDWILNEDDGDGNDGNLNYNFNQFLIIDKNLSDWRLSLKDRKISLKPLELMGLPNIFQVFENDLYYDIQDGISPQAMMHYYQLGIPDVYTASQLIKIQLNFHCVLIRSMNYLNFIVDKELNFNYYKQICQISQEVLQYFLMFFDHVSKAQERPNTPVISSNSVVMESLGLDVDEDGFVINDFSVKRRRPSGRNSPLKRVAKEIPMSPYNAMLNGLSLTVINFKKSIVLQMLYLLICQMKFVKRNDLLGGIHESIELILKSIDMFSKVFINYRSGTKLKEDKLYEKLVNDELREDILKYQENSDVEEDEEDYSYYKNIDWDDEELDEDLKYLKILKFIKYKCQKILQQTIDKNSILTYNQPKVYFENNPEDKSAAHDLLTLRRHSSQGTLKNSF